MKRNHDLKAEVDRLHLDVTDRQVSQYGQVDRLHLDVTDWQVSYKVDKLQMEVTDQ